MIEIKAIAAGIVAAGSLVGAYSGLAAFGVVNRPVFEPTLAAFSERLKRQECNGTRLLEAITRGQIAEVEREQRQYEVNNKAVPLAVKREIRRLTIMLADLDRDKRRFC